MDDNASVTTEFYILFLLSGFIQPKLTMRTHSHMKLVVKLNQSFPS